MLHDKFKCQIDQYFCRGTNYFFLRHEFVVADEVLYVCCKTPFLLLTRVYYKTIVPWTSMFYFQRNYSRNCITVAMIISIVLT